MGQVKVDNVSLEIAVEASLGVLPGSPVWYLLEPNDITDFGATITTTPREPISSNRQRRKGTTTDLDSTAGFEHDLTREVFLVLSEGFVFATYQGNQIGRPTATDTDSYTVPSGPTLIENTLVFARGFTNAANNGLKEVAAGATATDIPVEAPALVAETPPANAFLEIAGFRCAANSINITVSGTTATLARILGSDDYTTIGLHVGQLIHVGGLTSGEQFSAGAGYGRVRSFTATTIVLDKLSSTLATDDGMADTVDLLFGLFLSNVAVSSGSYLERSYTLEVAYPNLNNPPGSPNDAWQYSNGNLANEMELSLATADKALVNFNFVGLDTPAPVTTRAMNADSPIQPLQDGAYNTSADVLRLRVLAADESGLTTCFKDVSLTLGNGVTPEKCIGTLGAVYMNTGLFTVDLDGEVLFTSPDVAAAVRANDTVSMDILLKNADGAISIDVPSMTLGDGQPNFPVHESVTLSLSGQAFQDAFFGTSIGISTFPVVP